jgi:hypothetical protein
LFSAVLFCTGEGACARPGGSAYPHYCSLLTRVDSAEADRLVARDSASARTSVLQLMRPCGITAPPRRGKLLPALPVVGCVYRRLRQPPQIGSGPTGRTEKLPHLRQVCQVSRIRHRRARRRASSATHHLHQLITSLPPFLKSRFLCRRLFACSQYSDPGFDCPCVDSFPRRPVQGFAVVSGIGLGDMFVHLHRVVVIGKPYR